MIPPHLSIFDISHIVDVISDHLSSKDIWCCYRVNRTWSQAFNLYRYKNVHFAYPDPHQTSHILHNAHMIRNLTVDLWDARCLLDARCTRLKDLVCTDEWYTEYRETVKEFTSSSISSVPGCICVWRSGSSSSTCTCTSTSDEPPRPTWGEMPRPTWGELPRLTWGEPLGSKWPDSDLTGNALLLISRNPGLEQLTVNDSYKNSGRIFSQDILTALSVHQSLRKISFNILIPMGSFGAILKHLPRTLHDLELDGRLEWRWDEDPPELELTHTLQLRRLVLRKMRLPCRYLISLLQQSPCLEEISLEVYGDFGSVMTALAEYCPRLKSIDLKIPANEEFLYAVDLVRVFPTGLRSFILESILNNPPYRHYFEELIEALLEHSSHTLEVLKIYGEWQDVVNDINAVLEGFPNLIELQVPHVWFHLEDIVPQRNWTDRSLWETDPSTGSTGPSLTLPWACTKLETLSLFIGEPLTWDFENVEDEVAISVVCGFGILWNTLKSLKSFKTLSLYWSSDINRKLGSMRFERGVSYMKQIGLPEMTQQEAAWMGMKNWGLMEDYKSPKTARLYFRNYRHGSDRRRHPRDV
ncbi:MAG: hypothetical protein J3Q66DRAFT_352093 [Benniella sp.]|nr:MAG: hypothetical protein J3Q66DRAFT_352093 [Benniella sp.]